MQILNYEWVGVKSNFFAKKDAESRVRYTVLQVRKEGLLEDTETSPTMRETHRPLSWFVTVSGVLRWGSNGGGRGG